MTRWCKMTTVSNRACVCCATPHRLSCAQVPTGVNISTIRDAITLALPGGRHRLVGQVRVDVGEGRWMLILTHADPGADLPADNAAVVL